MPTPHQKKHINAEKSHLGMAPFTTDRKPITGKLMFYILTFLYAVVGTVKTRLQTHFNITGISRNTLHRSNNNV